MQKYFDVNGEGHSIRCKLYCRDIHRIGKMVLFGTGFGGHKDNKACERFAEWVMSKYKDIAVMTFNWPAHGDDVKQRIFVPDCLTYIRLVHQYIREELNVEDVYIYATSFGGYLFLDYIYENGNPFRKLALRCPAVNMYEVLTRDIMSGDEDAEKLKKGKDILVGFDRKIKLNRQFLNQLQEADLMKVDMIDFADELFILHGTMDEVVPFEASYTFADRNVIEFVSVEGADHRFQDPRKMDFAIQKIIDFFEF